MTKCARIAIPAEAGIQNRGQELREEVGITAFSLLPRWVPALTPALSQRERGMGLVGGGGGRNCGRRRSESPHSPFSQDGFLPSPQPSPKGRGAGGEGTCLQTHYQPDGADVNRGHATGNANAPPQHFVFQLGNFSVQVGLGGFFFQFGFQSGKVGFGGFVF